MRVSYNGLLCHPSPSSVAVVRGRRITAIMTLFQGVDAGSTPVARSTATAEDGQGEEVGSTPIARTT